MNTDSTCSVPNCTSQAQELPLISSDPVWTQQWLTQIGIPEDAVPSKVMVCKVHFDILMSYKKNDLSIKMSPSDQHDENLTNSKYVPGPLETYIFYEENEAGPSNTFIKLERDDSDQQNEETIASKEQQADLTNLPETVNQILKLMTDKCPQFRNQLGLRVYMKYPQVYKMYHKFLDLPAVSKLKSVLDNDHISCQKNSPCPKNILFEKIRDMPQLEKHCVLCLSEVRVKPHLYYDIKLDKLYGFSYMNKKPELAHLALILTAQGIFSGWTQLISITFIGKNMYDNFRQSHDVRQWIAQNTFNLFEIGYNVVGFVSEFKYIITWGKHRSFQVRGGKNRKVVYIYDISYLLKQFYFNFLTHDYEIASWGTAKMQYIVDGYKKDLTLKLKLNERHFDVTKTIEHVSMKHVMEVISIETAKAIYRCIDNDLIPKSAADTVTLISTMGKLFHLLNSDNLLETELLNGKNQKLCDLTCLQEMLTFIKKINLVKLYSNEAIRRKDTFLEQMITTVMSVNAIYTNIMANTQIDCFPTKYFGLAANITPFLKRVRKKSTNGTEPTSKELAEACRQYMNSNILKPFRAKHEEHDVHMCLQNISKMISNFKCERKKVENIIGKHITIKCSDYNKFKLKRRDDIVLVAGFILMKCYMQHHFCTQMKNYIGGIDKTSSIAKLMQSKGMEDICLVPHEKFIDFIEMMEIKYRSLMTYNIVGINDNKVVNALLSFMLYINFQMPCECFPLLYAKKLFLRLRIFNMLKYNNRLIKAGRNIFLA